MREGKILDAKRQYSLAVDITPSMARAFIMQLRKMGIEYYVAPYEADAQLAFLFHTKRAYAVITEDSDLLVYGVT